MAIPVLDNIRHGLIRLLGGESRSMIPGYGGGFGGRSASGVTVNNQSAMSLTAFFCGVNVISQDVAKLPFGVYEALPNGGQQIALKDPRHRLLRVKPNPEMNAHRYWRCVMHHALSWGNHYSEIVRDGAGMPTALWPLHPGTTRAMRDGPQKPLYYKDTSTGKTYRAENILHIAGLSFDGIAGVNPVTVGKQAIGLGLGAEYFGGSLFGNGAIPKGMLKTAKTLSEGAARRLREDFEKVHGGVGNANRVAVLEEGTEWVETQISPEASQFILTRQFQVIEICRLLNIPPNKLYDLSQSHLANLEESNMDYWCSTLQGWCEALEAEVDMKLFFEDEMGILYAEHDMRALLRGNSVARADYWTKLKSAAIVNADTVAAVEGLPIPGPKNGGDLYLVQSQNIPAQDAGKPKPQPPPAPEPKRSRRGKGSKNPDMTPPVEISDLNLDINITPEHSNGVLVET